MRITNIELPGRIEKGKKQPRSLARIRRRIGSNHIEVQILAPSGDQRHQIQADDDEDIRSMAKCLQYQLDGYKGTSADVDACYRELQRFAD